MGEKQRELWEVPGPKEQTLPKWRRNPWLSNSEFKGPQAGAMRAKLGKCQVDQGLLPSQEMGGTNRIYWRRRGAPASQSSTVMSSLHLPPSLLRGEGSGQCPAEPPQGAAPLLLAPASARWEGDVGGQRPTGQVPQLDAGEASHGGVS